MPPEGLDWLPKTDQLTDDEVVRLVKIGVEALLPDEPLGEYPAPDAIELMGAVRCLAQQHDPGIAHPIHQRVEVGSNAVEQEEGSAQLLHRRHLKK